METSTISHFLYYLGRTSAEACILIVLVLAASWLFRRQLAPRWRCALWLLVAARLLLPLSFSSATSVFNLLPQTAELNPVGMASLAAVPTAAADRHVPYDRLAKPKKPGAAQEPTEANRTAFATGPSIVESGFKWSRPICIFLIWLAGVLVLAWHVVVSSFRLWRRSMPLSQGSQACVIPLLQECCKRLQLRNPPEVFENTGAGSPALYGLLRPCLLLPKGFTEQFSPAEMRFVFLHELAHLKRRDLPMNWLVVALQVMHWFNPLIWLAFSRWRVERELACDAMALEAAGDGQNKEYGRTILRLLDRFSRPVATPGLVGVLEDKRQLRQRIGMIASFVPRQGWPRLAMALIVVLAAVGLTDARSRTSPPASSIQNTPPIEEQQTDSRAITQQAKGTNMSNTTITNRLSGAVAAGMLALASSTASADVQTVGNPTASAAQSPADDLTGAWILVGTPDHVGKAPSAGGRIKLFTGTHWCVSQAEPKTGVVLFHHGGTYGVSGNTFHANLNFANPSTMELIGKTNGNFTFKVEGDTLTSIGVDNPWKEVWKRLKPKGVIDSPLAKDLTGTWVYAGKSGDVNATPDTNRMKFYAGGYWCYTTTDPKTGVVVAHHGGYYSFEDGELIEACQYSNPIGMDLIGHDLAFKIKVEGDTLTLTGVNNSFNEVWKRLN